MALSPLLARLGLGMTLEGVQQLIVYLNTASGDVLLSPAVTGMGGVTALLNRLVVALVGDDIVDVDDIVVNLDSVIDKTLTCAGNLLSK